MIYSRQRLIIEQSDRKLTPFRQLDAVVIPPRGWINTIRLALKMSLRQLGNRLSISPQSVKEFEDREVTGTITLKSLKDIGAALDMKFVYGFIPKSNSLEEMIEKRALEVAREIVLRTSQTMKLEDQENSNDRLGKAIKNKAAEIVIKMPKFLWD